MVKNSNRISTDDMNGLEKKKYAALIAKDTSKTDNTTVNRSFERCVYAGTIAKKSVIGKSAANTVKETVRTTWMKKDSDGDGVPDYKDRFPKNSTETKDTDGDGKGDNSDKFPEDPNETSDNDGDGIGDKADSDDDNDGVRDSDDDMPEDPNETKDTDGDGVGDTKDDFINDPNESVKVTTISFDPNIAFQTVAVNTNNPVLEDRFLHLSTNDSNLYTNTRFLRNERNGTYIDIVQYVKATTGKQYADIGQNLRALFPGDWIQYLYEPIRTWNGSGNNVSTQDWTTFYDIIQFQQTYNGIKPQDWIIYVANDTERRSIAALGGAQQTDGPNIYFNVVIVNNEDRLPESGNADKIRYYRNQRTPSWYSIRSHYPVMQNRGVVGYGLSVMAQGRSFSTPDPIGMQYAPIQEVSYPATILSNGMSVVPGGSIAGNMPNDLYDHIYYHAYLNGISNYNFNTSNNDLNATDAQNQAKAYADTWVRWVEATDNTSASHVSIGRDGENYYYRGGYYEFRAADPDKTTTNGKDGPIVVKGLKWFDARLYTPMNPNNYYIRADSGSWKDSTNKRQVEMFDEENVVKALKFMSIATQRVFGQNTEPIVKDVNGTDVTGQRVIKGSPYYYTSTPQ